MKITDVLSLITCGYNKEDLQAIKELAKDSPDVIELAKQCKSMGDLNALLQLTSDEKPEEKPEEKPDYQKLYEGEKIKLAELEKKLKETQEKATRTDVKERPKTTSEDILKDIAKNFI